nr:conserved hypothetical protein [Bartonella sp. AR 15-3]
MSGPTYGTDKTVSLQFFDDITNLASLRSKNKNSQLVMKQRSQLVFPEPSARVNLPLPQVDSAEINSHNEIEMSKQFQKNLRNGVGANKMNANFDDPKGVVQLNEKQQREEYLRRRKEAIGGNANYRRYLSEPPLIYRQPAVTAPAE